MSRRILIALIVVGVAATTILIMFYGYGTQSQPLSRFNDSSTEITTKATPKQADFTSVSNSSTDHYGNGLGLAYIVVNGTIVPAENDTAQRETIPYADYDPELFNAQIDYCRNQTSLDSTPVGDSSNPATVVIGSTKPAIIPFCVHNTKPMRYIQYLKTDLYEEFASNTTALEGLNITLSTKVVDLPPFDLSESNNTANVIIDHINVYVQADSGAKLGKHSFEMFFRHPVTGKNDGMFETVAYPVTVDVRKN